MEVLGWRSSDNNLPATSIFAESPRGIFSVASNQMLCTLYSDMLEYKGVRQVVTFLRFASILDKQCNVDSSYVSRKIIFSFCKTTIHAKSSQILIKGMFFVRLFLSQVDQRSAFKHCARYFYHSMEGARMKKFL